ncbi:guanylate cyclase soluble subunit beta-2-like [Lineus longissimus]|uniref:guanylate cyclase soluble subunit beta-2-like n=1 Tax=Lineus longissimus TaxID=88925 RepID=UPI002B4D064D
MYGQIHVCIRQLVLEKFGEEAWKKILAETSLNDTEHFLVFKHYCDGATFTLVGAVAKTLGLPAETVLEVFGEYFLEYCMRHGYDKMMKTLGEDFASFVQNLDSFHALLAMSYENIDAPSFRCETNPDGSLTLHYYSSRPGLQNLVIGILRSVGKKLFDTHVETVVQEIHTIDISNTRKQYLVIFRIVLTSLNEDVNKSNQIVPAFQPVVPDVLRINAKSFCQAFPYHILFDTELRIVQCGVGLQKMCRQIVGGVKLSDVFEMMQPNLMLSMAHLRRFINACFIIREKEVIGLNSSRIVLKGQMIWMEDVTLMLFICSPRLSSLNEMAEKNLFLSDIPIYDVTRELILLNQQRIAEIEISKKLDETTAELTRTGKALEEEKRKTDELLYQMLPVKVANQLREHKQVEAEKFDQVTILFSDIVTFTNIAAACTPIHVVNMLNSLYSRFDQATTVNNVYKVETIGDAYMVVGGVPEVSDSHAESVADMAMDMIEEASHVTSPASGLPLQIRVGIHSGPVVAGVVGAKMPRYCLFGDTVNTASRMESHSIPGRIHLSSSTYSCVRCKGFSFEERGEIEVKGKGKMTTYFLLGKGDVCVPLPPPGTPRTKRESVVFTEFNRPVLSPINRKITPIDEGKETEDSTTALKQTEETLLVEITADNKAIGDKNSIQNGLGENDAAKTRDSNANAFSVDEKKQQEGRYQKSETCTLL